MTAPAISFVIPCHDGGDTLPCALASIVTPGLPPDWRVEAVVVDDGSRDADAIRRAVAEAGPGARLLRHDVNRGTAAARNTGIAATTGDVVVMLDCDDHLVADWPRAMERLLAEWPPALNACGSWCVTPDGALSVEEPRFTGPRGLADMLADRHGGEYLPIFRGDYIRARGYVDIGLRRGCEILTYLGMAREAPFWISDQVLRVYETGRTGSITSGWMRQETAAEMVALYDRLEEMFGDDYRRLAPLGLRRRRLRRAVYRRLAGHEGAWADWRRGAHPGLAKESLAAALLLLFGRALAEVAVPWAKRSRLIRRFG